MENKIEKAKEFATKAHKGQVRKGRGSPYTEHLEEVAKILMDMDASENVICAGWLHDTVEDTGVSLEQLTQVSTHTPHAGRDRKAPFALTFNHSSIKFNEVAFSAPKSTIYSSLSKIS